MQQEHFEYLRNRCALCHCRCERSIRTLEAHQLRDGQVRQGDAHYLVCSSDRHQKVMRNQIPFCLEFS